MMYGKKASEKMTSKSGKMTEKPMAKKTAAKKMMPKKK